MLGPDDPFFPEPPLPLRRLRLRPRDLAESRGTLETDLDLAYADAGQGPPLVFIHGVTATIDYWRHNLEHFSRRHRVIACDLPGMGRSSRPADAPYSVPFFARTVFALLDRLGVESASLVGNSLGGQIALAMALRAPERIQRLVLVNPAGASVPPRWLRRAIALATRSGLLHVPTVPERVWALAFRLVFPGRPELIADFARRYRRMGEHPDYPSYVRAAIRAYLGVLKADLRQSCRAVRPATLVIWGRRDGLLRISGAHRLRERIPGARLLIYDDSGHCPMIDQPERFNRDVSRFLAGDLPDGAW